MTTHVVHKGTGIVVAEELLDILAAHPNIQERVTARFGPPAVSKLLSTEISNDKRTITVSIEPRPKLTDMLRYARQLAKES